MDKQIVWVQGGSRSGKTQYLVEWAIARWQSREGLDRDRLLILASNDESKREIVDRLTAATEGKYSLHAKTPNGFVREEVLLYYPLLCDRLKLPAHFPLILRPETEQELATLLWQPALERENWRDIAPSEYRFVRRSLDLVQLAASSGNPMESIPDILSLGFRGEVATADNDPYGWLGSLTSEWRDWCLDRGLLTYGIMTALYWRYLFPDRQYREALAARYGGVLADDVDDYPAMMRQTVDWLLEEGKDGAFSFNPDGMVRLGLNADPDYWWQLPDKFNCGRIQLHSTQTRLFANSNADGVTEIVNAITTPGELPQLPPNVHSIIDRTRGETLRLATQEVIDRVQAGDVAPQDVAILAPGLDAIARYTIVDMFDRAKIPLASLNEQRPLNSDANVRALLTILALIYPNLGQLVSRDDVADLLVALSPIYPPQSAIVAEIDPVRAGLLADYCFAPSMDRPQLLQIDRFPRWDRLGATVADAYDRIVTWIDKKRQQPELPLQLLDLAIHFFFASGSHLSFDRLSNLRELMETAQHYWQVAERLRGQVSPETQPEIVARFIILLRRGTVTANPYPFRQFKPQPQAVTLSNIFQYRASKQHHPWHFWLDVGSPLWAEGGSATLYGANLFLKDRSGKIWTEADTQAADERRLERVIGDLLHRVEEKLYLCHSELAIDGQEAIGPLLTLVHSIR